MTNPSDVVDEIVLQAVARGWCSPENQHKEMDAMLAQAIAREVSAEVRRLQATARAESIVLDPTTLRAKPADKGRGWQPIATAPRDGVHVLLWHVGKYNAYRTIGSAQSDHPVEAGRGWCDLSARPLTPTHWQPLPPPPAVIYR